MITIKSSDVVLFSFGWGPLLYIARCPFVLFLFFTLSNPTECTKKTTVPLFSLIGVFSSVGWDTHRIEKYTNSKLHFFAFVSSSRTFFFVISTQQQQQQEGNKPRCCVIRQADV